MGPVSGRVPCPASLRQSVWATIAGAAAAEGIGLSNAIPQGRVAVAPGSDVSPPRGDPAAAHDPLPPARVSSDAEYHSVSGDLERAFADEVTAGWFRPRPLFEGSVGQCTRGAHSSSQKQSRVCLAAPLLGSGQCAWAGEALLGATLRSNGTSRVATTNAAMIALKASA